MAQKSLSAFPTSSYRLKMIEYSWDGRDCLSLESSPTMARAGVEGVGCGDQCPGQCAVHWDTLTRRLCFAGGGEESRGVRKGTVAWEYSASLATQFQWQIHFSGALKLGPKTCHGAVATVQTTAHKIQPGIWRWELNRMEHIKSEGYSQAPPFTEGRFHMSRGLVI